VSFMYVPKFSPLYKLVSVLVVAIQLQLSYHMEMVGYVYVFIHDHIRAPNLQGLIRNTLEINESLYLFTSDII